MTPTELRAKMCAVLLGQQEHSLPRSPARCWSRTPKAQRRKYDALADYGLDDFYWRRASPAIYGYTSARRRAIDDFVLVDLPAGHRRLQVRPPGGLQNIQLDFASLRNDRAQPGHMATLAKRAADDLDYKSKIEDASFRDLVAVRPVRGDRPQDHQSTSPRAVAEQTVTAARGRRGGATAPEQRVDRRLPQALRGDRQRLRAARGASPRLTVRDRSRSTTGLSATGTTGSASTSSTGSSPTPTDRRVPEARWKHCATRSRSATPTSSSTSWATPGSSRSSRSSEWQSAVLAPQTSFFDRHVAPVVSDGRKKAVVIISDALRYEVADELGSRIRQEDRFDADLEPCSGCCRATPSSAWPRCLPHSTLRHSTGRRCPCSRRPADERHGEPQQDPASGAGARRSRPRTSGADPATSCASCTSSTRSCTSTTTGSTPTGDKPGTERQVFEAAEDTLARPGRPGEEAGRTPTPPTSSSPPTTASCSRTTPLADSRSSCRRSRRATTIKVTNRRYVLGRGLKVDPAFTTFTSAQLGLDSDIDVQIPKSIHRLRLPGAGSRFVHGGATLQEIVVPVLAVNKKRKSDTRPVNVEVLPETDKITTGQLVVKLFQSRGR